MESIKLNNSVSIPILGLGTWNLRGDECTRAVNEALAIGYRHIDTAEFYRNHKEIGKALKKTNVKREDIFITTKVPPYKLRKKTVIASAKKYCKELGIDYLDLLLIHWPNPMIRFEDPLEAFEELLKEGVIRSYGVSNYGVKTLKRELDKNFKVSVNQVEFHPTKNPKELKEFCDKNNVVITAYTPLGKGNDLNLDIIKRLAKKYEKSEAQVILNWEIGKGMVTIPKAAQRKHLLENFNALGWKLDKKDIESIDSI